MITENIGDIAPEDFIQAFIQEMLVDVEYIVDQVERGQTSIGLIKAKAVRSYLHELQEGMK